MTPVIGLPFRLSIWTISPIFATLDGRPVLAVTLAGVLAVAAELPGRVGRSSAGENVDADGAFIVDDLVGDAYVGADCAVVDLLLRAALAVCKAGPFEGELLAFFAFALFLFAALPFLPASSSCSRALFLFISSQPSSSSSPPACFPARWRALFTSVPYESRNSCSGRDRADIGSRDSRMDICVFALSNVTAR